MDPILVSAAAVAIQEGISLIQQYANGSPDAEALLKQWVAARDTYNAGKKAFDDAGGAPAG